MTIKKMIVELNKRVVAIGLERDNLRDLIRKAEDLEALCGDAFDSLQAAIDKLSELT